MRSRKPARFPIVILTDFGYRVRDAAEAAAALRALDEDAEIALLFTDIVMPGSMNGFALAKEAKRRRPVRP